MPIMPEIITSPANSSLARVRALLARRDRRAEDGSFVIEGVRAVADALTVGVAPSLLLLREDVEPPEGLPVGIEPRRVAYKLFDALSDVANPQGILAVVPMPDLPVDPDAIPLLLVIDRLRDPGNLGTLLRTAAGAGVTCVYLTPATVDPFNPKVVRAGMGAHWRVPIRDLAADPEAVRALAPTVAVTASDAPLSYDAVDWTGPSAIVIGAEADGVSPEIAAGATSTIAIPLHGSVESLNAASAGAAILFEAARQRRAAELSASH
jgi:RNA methyltransferase, TrmH family